VLGGIGGAIVGGDRQRDRRDSWTHKHCNLLQNCRFR